MNVELEVLDWITNGYLPEMSKTQGEQLDRDLVVINEERIEDSDTDLVRLLNYNLSFDEHFIEPVVKPASTTPINVYTDDSNSDSDSDAEDSDDDILFDSSSSDSDIPNVNLGYKMKDRTKDCDVLDLSEDSLSKDDTSKVCKELTLTKDIKSFLLAMTQMTECPMLYQEMEHPFLAPDKQTYERDAISRWLRDHHNSPMTREPMEMAWLMEDHTMKKVIDSMNDCHITAELINSIGNPPPTPTPPSSATKPPHSLPEEITGKPDYDERNYTTLDDGRKINIWDPLPDEELETLPPSVPSTIVTHSHPIPQQESQGAAKRRKKQIRLKQNRKCKKRALKILNEHIKYLQSKHLYDVRNFKVEMPPTPSYSIMHSLKDGFSIMMYSGSHRVNLRSGLCLHSNNSVRIILPEWMAIIWHEALYHGGAMSRTNPEVMIDMRFFAYIWPLILNNRRNRNKGSMDGVARELGENLYRDGITDKICQDLYKDYPQCLDCLNLEGGVIDLSDVPSSSYNPGDIIIGDLEQLGWVVVRGVRVTEQTYAAIDKVSKVGATKDGSWTSIEDHGGNRQMKYSHTQKVNRDKHWKQKECNQFLVDVKEKILDRVLIVQEGAIEYDVGSYNLLKNKGYIGCDQQAHTDYPPRLVQ